MSSVAVFFVTTKVLGTSITRSYQLDSEIFLILALYISHNITNLTEVDYLYPSRFACIVSSSSFCHRLA